MAEYAMISNEEKYYRLGLNIAYQRKLKTLHKYNLRK